MLIGTCTPNISLLQVKRRPGIGRGGELASAFSRSGLYVQTGQRQSCIKLPQKCPVTLLPTNELTGAYSHDFAYSIPCSSALFLSTRQCLCNVGNTLNNHEKNSPRSHMLTNYLWFCIVPFSFWSHVRRVFLTIVIMVYIPFSPLLCFPSIYSIVFIFQHKFQNYYFKTMPSVPLVGCSIMY